MRTLKFLSLLLLLAPNARAERRNPLDGQPAIRHRVEMRSLRFEVTPEFITSTNQDYRHAFGPGLMLRFHIFDWLGIGVQGGYFFNANTPLEDETRAKLPDQNAGFNYVYGGDPQPSLQIHDQHVLNTKAVGSIFLTITPWSGKFALFSAAFASYDFFVDIGGGIVYYTQNGCCTPPASEVGKMNTSVAMGGLPDPNLQDASQFAGVKGAGMVGVGVHIYFTDWVGLTLELRDYFAKSNPGGLDTNGDRVLNGKDETMQNHLFFGFGITFMLPPTAKISR
jgi:hypothetical protein